MMLQDSQLASRSEEGMVPRRSSETDYLPWPSLIETLKAGGWSNGASARRTRGIAVLS